MLGQLQLISYQKTTLFVPNFVLVGQFNAIGLFLVGIEITGHASNATTYLTKVTRQSTLVDPDLGSIPPDEEVFRTRHVQRRFWSPSPMWVQYQVVSAGPTLGYYYWSNTASPTFPNGANNAHYSSPFVKPASWASSPSPTPLSTTPSTDPADRYAADFVNPLVQPDPVFFVCELKEGQSLYFENKAYQDDPFRDDPTTPHLDDVIPTTTDASDSEIEITHDGSVLAWMVRI